MPIKRRVRRDHSRIDMTSLVDVMFFLLVFFILTSSFMLQPGIKVDLPQATSSESVQMGDNLLITVTTNGNIYVNDAIVSLENLSSILVEAKKTSAIIQADADVSLGRVVMVWDVCRRSGLQEIHLAAAQKKR